MTFKHKTIRNHEYLAAGHRWLIPEYHLIVFDDGEEGVSQVEIERVHRAIANEICGAPEPLTFDELEFLADTAGMNLADVARVLDVHRSTITKWRGSGSVSRGVFSTALKRHFWFELFGEALRGQQIPMEVVGSEPALLSYIHDQAIGGDQADRVSKVAA
ncbi:MAG: hypothetical protein KKI08_12485 [Armatimonadetes bacterium]|nr:hypothetical protein [Armatimonadota bacterium]